MSIYLFDDGLDGVDLTECIAKEDKRQLAKWGKQLHTIDEWNTILGEEVGEVAKAVCERNLHDMQKESISVATLALKFVAMIEKYELSLANKEHAENYG